MGYKLCMTEKPSVAKDIANVVGAKTRQDGYFEGNGYLITWAVGHLVGLAEPQDYGFTSQQDMFGECKEQAYNELPLIPDEFKLVVLENTKKQFQIVKKLIHRDDVDMIIDCGDMGAEGHILQWFIRVKAGCDKPVKRFCATSYTDEAILKAMNNLRPIEDFENIIKGEYCKKKADWITGMSLSRCETLKYNTNISVGRVQSPTLYFVVQKYLALQKFKVSDYYTFEVAFNSFKMFWNKDKASLFPSSVKDTEDRLIDRTSANNKLAQIKSDGQGVITHLDTKKKASDRPQLYDITELQREANRRFGYSPAMTLATAQSLYETHKVLSYPRTDSRYITSDLEPYMKERIKGIGSIEKYSNLCDELLKTGLNIDKKIVDDSKVTDHHAIIPTEKISGFRVDSLVPSPDEKRKGVTVDSLKNIFDLVLSRMIVSFSKPFIYEETVVNVKFACGIVFSASGKKVLDYGFKSVESSLKGYSDSDKEDGDDEEQIFPNLSVGQSLPLLGANVVPKKTTPPKLHTEATLLTAMENAGAKLENGAILKGKGIGTQATRGEIINKLLTSKYVEYEKKGKTNYLKPTSKGLSVIRVLPVELYSPKITADWETKISEIASGRSTEHDFMDEFKKFIHAKVSEVKEADTGIVFKSEREVHGVCPWCGSPIYLYEKKVEGSRSKSSSFYCSEKCGFNLDVSDQLFMKRLGRKLKTNEAKKFMADKLIVLNCKTKDGESTYKGEFSFKKREIDRKSVV